MTAAPTLLTTTDGIIEDATSLQLSKDGKTLYYTTNHGDIDRRDIWAVPTAGGTAEAGLEGRRHRDVPDAVRIRHSVSRRSTPMRAGRSQSA